MHGVCVCISNDVYNLTEDVPHLLIKKMSDMYHTRL